MTMHIAEHETPKIVESGEALAEVIYLPSMPAVELGIQELNGELRRIAIAISIKREVCAINLEVNEEELDLTPSVAESHRLSELRIKLGKLEAIRTSIIDSIRIAHEDKIREDEKLEHQYFAAVSVTNIDNKAQV